MTLRAIITSFETNTEGWVISGDAASVGWVSTGGNPGGAMQWVDAATGSDAVWSNSAQFAGNRIAFYGGTLSYDIEVSGNGYDAGWTAYLVNSATNAQLYVHVSQPTAGSWNHISLNLDTSTPWTLGLGGALATEADIRDSLRHLGSIVIRAEYVNGNENGGLDNVAMVEASGRPICWNVFTDASDQTPTPYGSLTEALAGSAAGNVLTLDNPTGLNQNANQVAVHTDNLTIHADTALFGTLVFDSAVLDISLVGTTGVGVTGNTLNNTIGGSQGNNVLSGGDGNDTIFGRAGKDLLTGGNGADTQDGGTGHDTFFFNNSGESTGVAYDTFVHYDSAHQLISLPTAVTGIDTAITTGALQKSQFDANLAVAVNSSNLAANHAVLFTADSGNMAGKTFLVVDTNGTAGYQAGDLVVLMTNAVHLNMTTADFITHV